MRTTGRTLVIAVLLAMSAMLGGLGLGAGTALASDPSTGYCEAHEDGVVTPANGGAYICHHDPVYGWVWKPW